MSGPLEDEMKTTRSAYTMSQNRYATYMFRAFCVCLALSVLYAASSAPALALVVHYDHGPRAPETWLVVYRPVAWRLCYSDPLSMPMELWFDLFGVRDFAISLELAAEGVRL